MQHRLGTLDLDVSFTANAPWTVLFGPSGSGKSTVLRAIAGLLRPAEARIVLCGQTVADSRAWVPAHLRPVRWSSQTAALFPRMTVRENIAFAMDSTNTRTIDETLKAFQINGLAKKHPAELSGGQRQRVAVARAAIAASGRLLLLDEPFTGLDAPVRDALIASLRTWLGETPILSVTHDVAEVFQLGAEVIRIAEGRVVAQGPPPEVLAEERDRLRNLLGLHA
jgi:molybdate transport system ATP-binding protein